MITYEELTEKESSEFSLWFKYWHDGMPNPIRLKEIEKETWEHINALTKLGKEAEELRRLQVAWTDCLNAWEAARKVHNEVSETMEGSIEYLRNGDKS